VTLLLVIALAFVPGANFFGAQGLIDRLLAFIQTLAGFYIAALAAVSSFNSPHLDRVMPKPAPTMTVKHNGGVQKVPATRRRFLTSMFAYLTALSILFSLVAIAALTIAGPVSKAFPEAATWLRLIGLGVFLFIASQLFLVTLWGLFYLGERMLTPD